MATKEDYRLIIEREWADIHHSRVQEWTCLGVVTGAHLGLIQTLKLIKDLVPKADFFYAFSLIGCAIGVVFCVLGLLMTCRHRTLMIIKLDWIFQAEENLDLIDDKPGGIIPREAKKEKIPKWNDLTMPIFLSSSGIIFSFYLLLLSIDIGFSIFFINVLFLK